MASQQALAQQYQRQQAALSATVTRDVLALWLAGFKPGVEDSAGWRILLALLGSLVRFRHAGAAGLAAAYYRRARAAADAGRGFVPAMAAPPPQEQIAATAGATGPGAYTRSLRAGRTVEQARRNAGVQLSGAMARLVTGGGRETIQEAVRDDDDAIGWVRLTGPRPCAFCAMLAGRGPAYESRATASFQAHDHCRCIPAAVFSRDEAWLGHSEDLATQWQQVTAGYSGAAARRAWRRHWDNRNQARKGE